MALFSREKTACPSPEALQHSPDSSCEPQSQPAPYVPWSLPTLASYPPHQPPCPVAFSLLPQLTGGEFPPLDLSTCCFFCLEPATSAPRISI